jgi:hypothetical protein
VFKESYKNQNKREKEEKEEPTSSLAKREAAKMSTKDPRLKRLERKKTKIKSGISTSKDMIEKVPSKDTRESTTPNRSENDTTSIDSRNKSNKRLSESKNYTFSHAEEEE